MYFSLNFVIINTVMKMIFDPKKNYNVKNVFKQSWQSGSKIYVDFPRPRHGLVLMLNGSISFTAAHSVLNAVRGDIILLPKNSLYETVIPENAGETSDFLINFEGDDIPVFEPTRLLSKADSKYYDIFNKTVDIMIKASESDFVIKGQLYTLLDHIVRDMDCKDRSDRYFLEKAKGMLEDDKSYSISDIALKCGISESGFRSIFKKAYGISPIEYKMNVRLNKAKLLLHSTDMTVEEIAEALNFYDTAYFSKLFKKHTGFSPKEYSKGKSL